MGKKLLWGILALMLSTGARAGADAHSAQTPLMVCGQIKAQIRMLSPEVFAALNIPQDYLPTLVPHKASEKACSLILDVAAGLPWRLARTMNYGRGMSRMA